VNRDTAELCGRLGVDILVVGSTLWKKGQDIEREIALIKTLADKGYRRSVMNSAGSTAGEAE
jgi:pentose-5-phosphate-3-epimerase